MAISIKTAEQIEKMRIAGRLAAQALEMISTYIAPGISTDELDQICHRYITEEQKAIPAPLNYKGFPRSICTSLNDVVCHGIPSKQQVLKKGDILNIDVTVIKDGFHGDSSKMFLVGDFSDKERQKPLYKAKKRLIQVTYECLYKGIATVKPGSSLKAIARAIQGHAESCGYSVVREYCGHGIGSVFHEPELQVLHFDDPKTKDITLQAGMTFTIEPMINMGRAEVKLLKDGWTVKTRDRSLSAQWEHTLLVTADGVEILTKRQGEPELTA